MIRYNMAMIYRAGGELARAIAERRWVRRVEGIGMATASIGVPGPGAWQGEFQAALAAAVEPDGTVSLVEVERLAELVIAIVGWGVRRGWGRQDDLGLVARTRVGRCHGQDPAG